MERPRIAVVGACVSRDAFNRSFAPEYRSHVELVASTYQSALPSLAREAAVAREIPVVDSPAYVDTLTREYSGQNLTHLIEAAPDILVVDFYSDVHFGVTQVAGEYVTRNHMAFTVPGTADDYYEDRGAVFPQRTRFDGSSTAGSEYRGLSQTAVLKLLERLDEAGQTPQVIVNAARFAPYYIATDGSERAFPNADRLVRKNESWTELEDMVGALMNVERISYPPELLVGLEQHKWGLNPVHYIQGYYDHFWEVMRDIIAKKAA